MNGRPEPPALLGWREWVGLPELGLLRIKAKVDTGARTSALHAFDLRTVTEDGRERVEFKVHRLQRRRDKIVVCRADILDQRVVSDSGGHREQRFVIRTLLTIGEYRWPIEMTLTSRDDMLFRMLLGRTALQGNAHVDPAASYLVGKPRSKAKRATE